MMQKARPKKVKVREAFSSLDSVIVPVRIKESKNVIYQTQTSNIDQKEKISSKYDGVLENKKSLGEVYDNFVPFPKVKDNSQTSVVENYEVHCDDCGSHYESSIKLCEHCGTNLTKNEEELGELEQTIVQEESELISSGLIAILPVDEIVKTSITFNVEKYDGRGGGTYYTANEKKVYNLRKKYHDFLTELGINNKSHKEKDLCIKMNGNNILDFSMKNAGITEIPDSIHDLDLREVDFRKNPLSKYAKAKLNMLKESGVKVRY